MAGFSGFGGPTGCSNANGWQDKFSFETAWSILKVGHHHDRIYLVLSTTTVRKTDLVLPLGVARSHRIMMRTGIVFFRIRGIDYKMRGTAEAAFPLRIISIDLIELVDDPKKKLFGHPYIPLLVISQMQRHILSS